MQKLRSLHLYLGCIFAPMLLFFAVSGIWQTFGYGRSNGSLLQALTTLHTAQRLKYNAGHYLNSPFMISFVVLMSLSFILTTGLGVVMAFKYGRSPRAAFYCLTFGTVFPLVLALLAAFKMFG